jgi:hypothetical protein
MIWSRLSGGSLQSPDRCIDCSGCLAALQITPCWRISATVLEPLPVSWSIALKSGFSSTAFRPWRSWYPVLAADPIGRPPSCGMKAMEAVVHGEYAVASPERGEIGESFKPVAKQQRKRANCRILEACSLHVRGGRRRLLESVNRNSATNCSYDKTLKFSIRY